MSRTWVCKHLVPVDEPCEKCRRYSRDILSAKCSSLVDSYKQGGWEFYYDHDARYVGARHPNGGKQSVCEVKNGFNNEAFGVVIAGLLNNLEAEE